MIEALQVEEAIPEVILTILETILETMMETSPLDDIDVDGPVFYMSEKEKNCFAHCFYLKQSIPACPKTAWKICLPPSTNSFLPWPTFCFLEDLGYLEPTNLF